MITDPAKVMTVQFYFQSRLKDDGVVVCFTGIMDIAQRWDVIRRAIINFGKADHPLGKRADGSKETYGQAFERATREPLQSKVAA